MTDKFKMALDVLEWDEQTLNNVLIEFAENCLEDIFKKIKNNNVKTLSQKNLNILCDEFMFALPDLIKQFQEENN